MDGINMDVSFLGEYNKFIVLNVLTQKCVYKLVYKEK